MLGNEKSPEMDVTNTPLRKLPTLLYSDYLNLNWTFGGKLLVTIMIIVMQGNVMDRYIAEFIGLRKISDISKCL